MNNPLYHLLVIPMETSCMGFWVLSVINTQIMVIWAMKLRSLAGGYQCFKRTAASIVGVETLDG